MSKRSWQRGPDFASVYSHASVPSSLISEGPEAIRSCAPLTDAVTAALEARSLGAIVIGQVATHRIAPSRSRIISELRDRPAIALVPVRDLLIVALAVPGIDNKFGRRLPPGLIWRSDRRSYGLIFAHGRI